MTRTQEREDDDRDSPWKEALDRYLEPCLGLLFPAVHAGIDWSRGWEPLDAELQQVVRDAELGRRYADKLYRVWLRDGGEAWVLVHVEVQGQVDAGLPLRMFVYHYRIFDRYSLPLVNLVILADDRPSWRPGPYTAELLGGRLTLEFPAAKLLDFEGREAALDADPNPFAVVVLAHLASIRTGKDPTARLHWKWTLTRALFDRGLERKDILELYRLIDWLLALPPALEAEFDRRLSELEEERTMPFRAPFELRAEARGLEKGREEGRHLALQAALEAVLAARLGVATLPDDLAARVREVTDAAALEGLVRRAALVTSLDEARALFA
ncbi:MAG: Rpn family recombination-promoting nuclease/putative transposase [Planctomycetota bacterium]|nr:Rpn family recombination-promoting nuclease/putative transposase [Planctomycetota bacterium]